MIFGAVSAVIFILSAMSVKNVDVYDPAAKNAKTEKKGFSLKETFSVITKNKASKAGFLFKSTEQIKKDNPELPAYETYVELMEAIKKAL